jgi:integrase
LRRHIVPLLGDCALTELTVKKMQTFVTTLTSGTRKAKTIENVLLTLSSVLGSARKRGYKVPEVSLSDLSLPRRIKAKPRCYSADEMARIVSSADEPLGTICFVLCSTGMRIGEVLALRLEDLDFKRQLIHVRSSVYAGTLGTPKSEASMASLPMPPALATRLKRFFWHRSIIARIVSASYLQIDGDAHSRRTNCGKRNFARCSLRSGFHSQAFTPSGTVSPPP